MVFTCPKLDLSSGFSPEAFPINGYAARQRRLDNGVSLSIHNNNRTMFDNGVSLSTHNNNRTMFDNGVSLSIHNNNRTV